MHIVLCGSMVFFEQMQDVAASLRSAGHSVVAPSYAESELHDEPITREEKRTLMLHYFDEIQSSDAILVYNAPKHEIPGYIGANTLIEMAVACAANKPIYLWEPVGDISAKEEIEAMVPTIIHGNLTNIV